VLQSEQIDMQQTLLSMLGCLKCLMLISLNEFTSYFVAYFTDVATEWRQQYLSSLPPPTDKLKTEVEQYMSEYDQKVEEVSDTSLFL